MISRFGFIRRLSTLEFRGHETVLHSYYYCFMYVILPYDPAPSSHPAQLWKLVLYVRTCIISYELFALETKVSPSSIHRFVPCNNNPDVWDAGDPPGGAVAPEGDAPLAGSGLRCRFRREGLTRDATLLSERFVFVGVMAHNQCRRSRREPDCFLCFPTTPMTNQCGSSNARSTFTMDFITINMWQERVPRPAQQR